MLDCKRIYADYSEKVYAYLRKHVSDAEAAAFITGLSYGAVKLRHRSALEKLRVYMQAVC